MPLPLLAHYATKYLYMDFNLACVVSVHFVIPTSRIPTNNTVDCCCLAVSSVNMRNPTTVFLKTCLNVINHFLHGCIHLFLRPLRRGIVFFKISGREETRTSIPKITHSGAELFMWLTMRLMCLYESGDSSGEVSLRILFESELLGNELPSFLTH